MHSLENLSFTSLSIIKLAKDFKAALIPTSHSFLVLLAFLVSNFGLCPGHCEGGTGEGSFCSIPLKSVHLCLL